MGKWWQWPTILSLDAAIVAVVWQDFLTRATGTALRPGGRWTLGLTVWAIYLADRIVDTRLVPATQERLPHRYYAQFPKTALWLLAAVVIADLAALAFVRPQVRANGVWLAAAVVAYLAVFSWAGWTAKLKPFAAALLFTCGVFLVAWTNSATPAGYLPPIAVGFFFLCLSNISLIGVWEGGGKARRAVWWLALLAAVAFLFVPIAGACNVALSLSFLGLAAIVRFEEKLSWEARRVLADAVLLSPLLVS